VVSKSDGNSELTIVQFLNCDHGSHHPSFFDGLNFDEYMCLMKLKLHLVPILSIPFNYFIHPHRTFLGLCEDEEVAVHGGINMSDDEINKWHFVSWVSSYCAGRTLLIADL
jgi:hypothetical protein